MLSDYLFMALMLLQVADVYTTLRILDSGGVERNKAMLWLMAELGPAGALVLAKIIMLMAMFLIWPSLPVWFAVGAVLFYAGIVINNLIVLRRLDA